MIGMMPAYLIMPLGVLLLAGMSLLNIMPNFLEKKRSGALVTGLDLLAIISFAALGWEGLLPPHGNGNVYAMFAGQLLNGTFRENSCFFSVRLAQIAPVAAFEYLAGLAIGGNLWSLVSYIGLILVCFQLGKLLVDDRAGAISALLISIFPNIDIAAHSFLDVRLTVSFFIALGALLLLLGERRKRNVYFLASGIALSMAPLADPVGAVGIVALFAYLAFCLWNRTLQRGHLYVLLGMLLVFVFLLPLNYALSGDPLITFKLTSGYFNFGGGVSQYSTVPNECGGEIIGMNNTIPAAVYNTSLTYYPQLLFPAFSSLVAVVFNGTSTGIFYYAFLACLVYLLALRRKSGYPLLIWFAAMLLYLQFGAMHMGIAPFSYQLLPRLPGFLEMVSPFVAVTIGIALSQILKGKERGRAKYIVLILVFLLIISSVYPNYLIPELPG